MEGESGEHSASSRNGPADMGKSHFTDFVPKLAGTRIWYTCDCILIYYPTHVGLSILIVFVSRKIIQRGNFDDL